jgi:hypothetical protein
MNFNDRELLARTLQAEAGNQGFGGLLDVGSVIMNRVSEGNSNLRDVILKPGQFSAWNSTTGYAGGEQGQDMANMKPDDRAYMVADSLLSGKYTDNTGGATHYYNPSISNPAWGMKAGGDWTKRGDHVFGRADDKRKKNKNDPIFKSVMANVGSSFNNISTGGQPMMQPEQKPTGLLGGLFSDPNKRARLAMALEGMTLNPNQGWMASLQSGIDKRSASAEQKQKASKTIEALSRMNTPQAKQAIEYLSAGGDPVSALKMAFGSTDNGVQSSSALRDRSGVVLTMRDGSIVVKTAGGETISGDAALKFVRDSEEAYAAAEKSIYGARTAGTLGAEAEFGAAAEAAKTSGKLSMELGFDTLDKANAVLGSLSTIDSAIAAIDGGAKAGPVYKMLPNITESSAALSTAMNQMGLDVISSVTFGALSEGEMKLAMETAVPRDLGPEALRSYLVKKRDAQAKAAAALQNAARYLTKPGNSISGWLDQQAQQQGSGTGAMPSTASGVSDDPLGIRE